MEEKKFVKTRKFIDNIAYKNKFQFLLWINDNVILQRYFRIIGFINDSIYSAEFADCMNEIVTQIQEDLKSKSRIFMWYTNTSEPLKINGFVTEKDVEKYGSGILGPQSVECEDGKVFTKEYIYYKEGVVNDYGERERPADGDFTLKFSFLIDDIPVYEKIWDANIYPRYVRNGIDLTNSMAQSLNEKALNNFSSYIAYHMQCGKTNLINDFIHKICDTLSNTYGDKFDYTKETRVYGNSDVNEEVYKNAIAVWGGPIKPVVTGHIDIKPVKKQYSYLSALKQYEHSWRNKTWNKTSEYMDAYPPQRVIDYWEKH